jgi:PadR family transcriptional regulator
MLANKRSSTPQGTLDMFILQTLSAEAEMHGFAIADAILERSEDVLHVEEGSRYPALQRLLMKGYVVAVNRAISRIIQPA